MYSPQLDPGCQYFRQTRDLGFDYGDNPGRLSLVHSISRYDACIRRPASPWDDEAFGTRGDVVMGLVSCVRWLPAYMRQTSTVVALTAGAMDSALAGDVDAPLFGLYMMGDGKCEQVKTRYAHSQSTPGRF